MDAFGWARNAADKLSAKFGDRLVFVGMQGSRARGEARDNSDIDLVVLLDHVCADDLAQYRSIIQTMPHNELACGFVGSEQVLASWPRHELFQFYHDTHALYGELPNIGEFTAADAREAARVGASGIYHAACHAYVFDGEAADDILESLFKGALPRLRRERELAQEELARKLYIARQAVSRWERGETEPGIGMSYELVFAKLPK